MKQRLMGLRSEKNIRRDFPSRFDLRDMPRGARVHVGSRGEADLHAKAEAFVKRRFEFGESLASAEGLRAGDEDQLVFFFAPAISDSIVSAAWRCDAVKSANASSGRLSRDDKFTKRFHDRPPIS